MRGRPGAEAMAAAGAASMAALSPHVAAAVAAAVAAGGSRHVVAATASAAIRVAMACAAGEDGDGHGSATLSSGGSEAAALCSETRPRGGSEVAARVDAIRPVLEEQVAAARSGRPAAIAGSARLLRNFASHSGFGEGGAVLQASVAELRRRQRGRRKGPAPCTLSNTMQVMHQSLQKGPPFECSGTGASVQPGEEELEPSAAPAASARHAGGEEPGTGASAELVVETPSTAVPSPSVAGDDAGQSELCEEEADRGGAAGRCAAGDAVDGGDPLGGGGCADHRAAGGPPPWASSLPPPPVVAEQVARHCEFSLPVGHDSSQCDGEVEDYAGLLGEAERISRQLAAMGGDEDRSGLLAEAARIHDRLAVSEFQSELLRWTAGGRLWPRPQWDLFMSCWTPPT